tara:strand:- start:384 stop:1427 length:1044 start_codon:yes stop_codon:yes gene_type:complete
MAAKTIFQPIDIVKYEDMGYDGSCLTIYGVPTDNEATNIQPMLFTENASDYREVAEVLQTETTDDLSNFSKAFVIPGLGVSTDRVKAALREHKITVTNDYEKCDFIVIDNCIEDNYDSRFRTTKMLHHKTNMYIVNENHFEQHYDDTGQWTVFCDKIKNNFNLHSTNYESAAYDLHGISGLAIELTHKIKAKEIDVVSIDTVLNASNNKQTLTTELVSQLRSMMQSNDDRTLAGSILPTIDYKTKPGLLWELAEFTSQRVDYDYNRNKDIKYWAEKANIRGLSRMSAEEALLHFEEQDRLDAETFKMLEPIIRSQISIHNRELYVFKVQIKPEYRKYFKKNKINENN